MKRIILNTIAQVIILFLATSGSVYALDPNLIVVNEDLLPEIVDNTQRIAYEVDQKTAALSFALAAETNDETGTTTKLAVIVDPGNTAVNTVSMCISYPTDNLKFIGVQNNDSAFAISFTEIDDPIDGVLVIHYFQPYPGVILESNVTNLNFEIIGSGTSTVSFLEETMVLANNGYGTDVLGETHSFNLCK